MSIHMLDNACLEQREKPKPARMREHIQKSREHLKTTKSKHATIDFINYYILEYQYISKPRSVK